MRQSRRVTGVWWLLLPYVLFNSAQEPLSAQVSGLVQDDTLAVQAAAIRRMVETIRSSHELGPLKTVCLLHYEDGKWLDEEEVGRTQPALERFLAEQLDLRPRPRSSCMRKGDSPARPDRLLRDADDGEAAAVLRISQPTFDSATSAILNLGYHFGPLWGQGFECHLVRTGSDWRISAWQTTWIS